MRTLEMTCEYCGKTFSFDYRQRHVRKYCSWDCKVSASKGQPLDPTNRIESTCDCCGKDIWYLASQELHSTHHYCSIDCRAKGRARNRRVVTCAFCGTVFTVKPSRTSRKYCSQDCANNAKIVSYTGENEKDNCKLAVYQAVKSGKLQPASNFSCSVCGEKQATMYHHPNGYDPEHRLDVVPVCNPCHYVVHQEMQ